MENVSSDTNSNSSNTPTITPSKISNICFMFLGDFKHNTAIQEYNNDLIKLILLTIENF